jgi:hypothetical protein
VTLKIIDANDLQSENTALKVPCLPPYAYHRLGWITIVLFIVVNIELRPTPGLAAWAVICISITAHEQAQSNRACNIFVFIVPFSSIWKQTAWFINQRLVVTSN